MLFRFENINIKPALLVVFLLLSFEFLVMAQPVPAEDENIPHLVTFGNKAATSWGDDDFCQIFFFLIPEDFDDPVYIRIFDPDCGGKVDEININYNTRTEFSIFGGRGCWSDPDAQGTQPEGNYRSGNLLASKTFGFDPEYDGQWYSFGPFNPKDGEYSEKDLGYIFKIITQGVDGDDGNLYQYYLSTEDNRNVRVEGGNAFTYEYTFRMWNDNVNISHIYPYIEKGTVKVKQKNFDWDDDGNINTYSVVRIYNKDENKVSGQDNWTESEFQILDGEIGKSLDFQFVKKKYPLVTNNNVVISTQNQYEENLRFFTNPIGGVPKYKPQIKVQKIVD
jgi:hypothetical protein